jgi:hypothetical protein
MVDQTNVLIPWYPISYLTIASSVFFLGAYGSLPGAAIWWCLRTGGGGVLTRLTRMLRRDIFFFYFVLFLRTGLRTLLTPLVMHHWPEKSADHGSRQLLPIASPMGCRHSNPTYRRHPHTMGEHTYARFGRPTRLGCEIV